jgi:glycosyltransferase involved in cell wall biosynthesis
VVVASDFEHSRLQTYNAKCRIETIPLPYEVDLRPADPMAFRRANNLEGKMIVLFLGRIDPKKGLDNLINAVASLHPQFPELVLVLGGDDRSEYARRLEMTARKNGLDRRVRFLGHLGALAKRQALAAADILALVSENENYGLVIVEAAAWGVPVLTTTQVGAASYFARSDAAMIVEPSYPAVVSGLGRLLSDQHLRRRLSVAGRSVAGGVLSWDACARAQRTLRLTILRERAA